MPAPSFQINLSEIEHAAADTTSLSNRLATLYAELQERMITQAFVHRFGSMPPWSLLVGRLNSFIFPDGCIVYTCDGIPFLQHDSGPVLTDDFRIIWRFTDFRQVPAPPPPPPSSSSFPQN